MKTSPDPFEERKNNTHTTITTANNNKKRQFFLLRFLVDLNNNWLVLRCRHTFEYRLFFFSGRRNRTSYTQQNKMIYEITFSCSELHQYTIKLEGLASSNEEKVRKKRNVSNTGHLIFLLLEPFFILYFSPPLCFCSSFCICFSLLFIPDYFAQIFI